MHYVLNNQVFHGVSGSKVSAYSAGDLGSVACLGRSLGEGIGLPLQYSCQENSMERGACSTEVVYQSFDCEYMGEMIKRDL